MKKKTILKFKYAWRTQKKLFCHPFVSFKIGDKDVNMFQFIHYGWKAIDAIIKD